MISSLIPSTRKLVIMFVAGTAFSGALLWNGTSDVARGLVSASEARVGRPLTPMSYAGVARRTGRRAAYGTAAAAAAGAAYAARPGCVRVTDAYGRVVTKC
jgi:hypothetical protein